MFSASYQIGRVWGIPIKLHLSLLIIVFWFAQLFGWVHGILLEVGLAGSIVLHELGHSLVALRKGCRVRQITLLCVGGAAQMERIPTRPRDEFLMAIAGPAVSLALGLILIPLGRVVPFFPLAPNGPSLVEFLGYVNIGLVVFNLLPAFPMDGGRVLRAALTPKLGRLKATAAASRLGQIMAFMFGIHGLVQHNWILVAVAFFVGMSAGSEYRLVRMQEAAKHFSPFQAFFGEDEPGGSEDRVRISPPPYEKGPPREADVHTGQPGRRGGPGP